MGHLDRMLEAYEEECREKYFSAASSVKKEKIARWFHAILNKNIFPLLVHIGFDKHLCQTLFQVAAPSWQSMGPVSRNILALNRFKSMDIEEIRKSFLKNSLQQTKASEKTEELDTRQQYALWLDGMAPNNLDTLLSSVGTSWIILPRAYALLKKEDARFLIYYIIYFKQENNVAFGKIIARILIEFLANYSLKYLSSVPHREQIIRAIFYGYAFLFWKNLRNPPEGLEEEEIFHYFLTWAKAYVKRSESEKTEFLEDIKKMEEMEKKIFPQHACYSLSCLQEVDEAAGLLIALRHGSKGVQAVCRYFGIARNALDELAMHHFHFEFAPKALSLLAREIRRNYAAETQSTKESINEVMRRIRNAYDIRRIYSRHQQHLNQRLLFAVPRIVQIVDNLMDKNWAAIKAH